MRIRCILAPGGAPGAPIRAPWPTYALIAYDTATGRCIVDVPDADIPPTRIAHPLLTVTPPLATAARARVPALEADIAAHLDARYRERAGEFRPRVV